MSVFKDELLTSAMDSIQSDYDFIREYFLTYILDKSTQRHAKFTQHCRDFQAKVLSTLRQAETQPRYMGLTVFNYLRSFIVSLWVLVRGSVLIIENQHEVNVPVLWASSIASAAMLLYMQIFRREYTPFEFMLNFSVLNLLSCIVSTI